MSSLTYRPAAPSDLPFIIGLSVESSIVPTIDDPEEAAGPDYMAALAAINADPNQEMLVAEIGGERVGCFQLTYIPGLMRRGMWRGLIEMVNVAPAYRNRGFGGEMMNWAVERCRARGCGMVQLTSNKKRLDAHRFYRRLGFEQSHEGFKLML
ncbi:MAG: GNAT family N-acetyltransferase [Devosia sp.]|nr:GNAT family N-acetyltransferase [Devosia sp.]